MSSAFVQLPEDPSQSVTFSEVAVGAYFTIPGSSAPDRVYKKVANDHNLNAARATQLFTVTHETTVLLADPS